MGVMMRIGSSYKKLVIVGLIAVGIGGFSDAMQRNEGPQPGYLHQLYEWWKKLGNRDFTLYAFPVAMGEDGTFYALINEDGTPFSTVIQHRPHQSIMPSPSLSLTTFSNAVPGLNIFWAQGEPMVGWGDVHQYYKERNQAYIAETLVEQKTNGCYKKGAGIQIDNNWFWGGILNYTKRACFMNRNSITNRDDTIVVFLKATYDPEKICKNINGSRNIQFKWIKADLIVTAVDEASVATQRQLRQEGVVVGKWIAYFGNYWTSKQFSTGGYGAGVEEKLFGKKSERKTVYRGVINLTDWQEGRLKQD